MNLNRIPIRPKISPKATATTVEETNPTKKRYMLLVIWSASEPSPIISMKASQVFTGFGKSAVFTPVRVQISCQTAISRITDEMLKPIFPAFLAKPPVREADLLLLDIYYYILICRRIL